MKPSIVLLLAVITACEVGITHDSEKVQGDIFSDTAEENEETSIPEEEEIVVESEDSASPESTEDADQPVTDFSQSGGYYSTKEIRTATVTNCSSMEYEVHTPDVDDPPVVVLGHGFARGSGVMTGWAEHLASWGVEVLLPTLCHYNVFFGVDHEMNGQNMIELAMIHGSENVVYAGHSAGGLAAIIAAAEDSNAIGVLGLDTTDTEDVPGVDDFIGRAYADHVSSPAFFIMGEPSTCNGENNGLDLFRMMTDYQIVKIVDSDHCDFENPTNSICEMSCENPTQTFSDSELRPVIVTLGTAAIMSLTGLSSDGSLVWQDGLEDWISAGLIQSIE